MKLYYSPGACSLTPHIVLREAGIDFDLMKVDLRAKKTEADEDFTAITAKGSVPALQLDDGTVITENAAILQYIGDHLAEGLVPENGTLARTRLQEMLSFISADYHKGHSPLFNPALPAEVHDVMRGLLARRHLYVEDLLSDGRPYLMGETFSVADAYFFVVTRWSGRLNISLDAYPNIRAFMARMTERPAVQAALKAEGLV